MRTKSNQLLQWHEKFRAILTLADFTVPHCLITTNFSPCYNVRYGLTTVGLGSRFLGETRVARGQSFWVRLWVASGNTFLSQNTRPEKAFILFWAY